MTHNFQRPNLPYDNGSRPNDNRFRIKTRVLNAPPTDYELDSEFNSVTDALNILDQDILNVAAGNIPGSDDPNSANMMLNTDGAGNISFKLVSDINCELGSISGNKLIASSVGTIQLADVCINSNKIIDGAVINSKLGDTSVSTSKLRTSCVTTEKINNKAVTTEKINSGAVTTAKIALSAVTRQCLGALAVGQVELDIDAVSTIKIQNLAVTTEKLNDLAVTAPKIALKTITSSQIADNTITFTQISNSFAATKAQQQAASSSNVFVSPAQQQNHPSAASFWCYFDGTTTGTNAPLAGFNVASVTRNSAGNYTINYTTNFSSTNYCVIPASGLSAYTSIVRVLRTSSCDIYTSPFGGSNTDQSIVCVVGYGAQ